MVSCSLYFLLVLCGRCCCGGFTVASLKVLENFKIWKKQDAQQSFHCITSKLCLNLKFKKWFKFVGF